MCNCKGAEAVLSILILVFAFWETMYSQWIIAIAAVIILVHALKCHSTCETNTAKKTPRSAKGRKR